MGDSRYPTGPTSCDEDPNCTPFIQSTTDWPMIIFYCYLGLVFGSMLLFFVYRQIFTRVFIAKGKNTVELNEKSESSLSKKTESKCVGELKINNEKISLGEEETSLNVDGIEHGTTMKLQGYRRNILGEIVYYLACSMNVMWFCVLLIVAVDCYHDCQLESLDKLCFYGNYPIWGNYKNGSYYFFTWWVCMLCWFVPWLWNRNKIRNWCRSSSSLVDAEYMWVWVKDEKDVVVIDRYVITKWVMKYGVEMFGDQMDGHDTTVVVHHLNDGTPYFIHEGTRYAYNEDQGKYVTSRINVGETSDQLHSCMVGLDSYTAEIRLDQVGLNEIPFKVTPIFTLLADEFTGWFYLYQTAMYSIQVWNAYIQYAIINTIIVVISGLLNVWVKYRGEKTIAALTKYSTTCQVKRDGKWVELDSKFLVPGDIVIIKSDWHLPCDFVLLQGSCVMNESGLTGESMPVQKVAFSKERGKIYDPNSGGIKNTLFASTIVLQAGTSANDQVIALVTGTGINTSKGELISSILFPSKMMFKYDEELIVVVTLLMLYGFLMFGLSMWFQSLNGSSSSWITKWAFGCGTMVQCMNPLLPVALTIGTVRSAQRLNGKGIFCINPLRISISGKIRVMCFDKTGTLTKEGLDFLGVQAVNNSQFSAEGMQQNANSKTLNEKTRHCLATCHALAPFNDGFVGNQVEMKMFQATGWDLVHDESKFPYVKNSDGERLDIVRRFEFDHGLQLMSVLVREANGNVVVYCKGSFEKIETVCKPEGIPEDYTEIARDYAMNGGYVLSISYANLGPLSDQEIESYSRDQVETDLKLLGLIVFRNELKEDTAQAILKLKEGDVRPVMITGDNAQCGYYISKQAHLINDDTQMFLAETNKKTQQVAWKRMGRTFENDESITTEQLLESYTLETGKLELAITGNNTYYYLFDQGYVTSLLPFIRIFSRMSPESKVHAVEQHKAAGLVTGMCGDGGNDCGALRAAHVGVALSDAEASLVSPFTSKTKSVQSIVDLLLEGRACLHTSFSMYKFLISNGLVLSMTKLILLWFGVLMPIMGYIMIDLITTFFVGSTMVLSLPEKKLTKKRPTHSLLGPITMVSVIGVTTINFGMTIIIVFVIQAMTGYVKWPANLVQGSQWWYVSDNWEASTLYFTMMQAYLTNALTFSIGYKYREYFFKNWPLMLVLAALFTIQSVLLLGNENSFSRSLHVMSEQFNRPNPENPIWEHYQTDTTVSMGYPNYSPAMSFSQRFLVYWLLILTTILAFLYQLIVAEGIIARLVRNRMPSNRVVTFA